MTWARHARPVEADRRARNAREVLTRFFKGSAERMESKEIVHHEEWTSVVYETPRGARIEVRVGYLHAFDPDGVPQETVDISLSTARSRCQHDHYHRVWAAMACFRIRHGAAVPMHVEEMRSDREDLREWLLEAAARPLPDASAREVGAS